LKGDEMYAESLENAAIVAASKVSYLKRSRLSYLIASMLAGAYVGLGIILIFSVGAPLASAHPPVVSLVMGLSFGIALTLVVFAGSELFTGNNMYMTAGLLKKKLKVSDLLGIVRWL